MNTTATTKTQRRSEVKALGNELKEIFGEVRKVAPFVGTWHDRPGSSLALHLDSKSTGKRIVIHKWDDEDTCSVRLIKGDFWRDPDNAVEYAEIVDVGYNADDIAIVIGAF